MYCGDETGAFVGELASHTCRFGYGGEDCPKSVVPSYMYADGTIPNSTHRIPPQRSNNSSTMDDIIPIFQPWPHATNNNAGDGDADVNPDSYRSDGIVENFDAWENAWCGAFDALRVWDASKHTRGGGVVARGKRGKGAGGVSSAEVSRGEGEGGGGDIMHPLLAIDSGHTHHPTGDGSSGVQYQSAVKRQQRTQMTEILFESLAAPAMFIAPAPMLAAFANGRQTALVVDVGASGTRVTPVVDGLLLENAQRRTGRGGEWLGRVQLRAIQELVLNKDNTKYQVHPRYAMRKGYNDNQTKSSLSTSENSSSKRRKNRNISIAYPKYTNVKETLFHRLAINDIMYEMKTGPHVTGVATVADEHWTVPFLHAFQLNKQNVPSPNKTTNAPVPAQGEKPNDQSSSSPMDVDEEPKSTNTHEAADTKALPRPPSSTSSSSEEEYNGPNNHDDDDDDDDKDDYESKAKKYYELPDGTRINLVKRQQGRDLCRLPELFFAPSNELPFLSFPHSTNQDERQQQHCNNTTLSSLPIHSLVKESLSAVADSDVRKELCGNIILTGASSLYTNMEQRLSVEISNSVPSNYKCKVIASRNTMERRYGSWIGGSVLTSLGSFQQLWLGRKEYEEFGNVLANQRFP